MYTYALQYWVEKTDLPTGGQPCWLAESVQELWEKMSCYLSFSDKEGFEGVTPPMPTSPVEEAEPHGMTAIPAIASKEQAAKETSQKPSEERKSPKFSRWEKVLHPSRHVVVAGQPSCPRSSEQAYPLTTNCNQPTKIAPTETPSPMQELEVAY